MLKRPIEVIPVIDLKDGAVVRGPTRLAPFLCADRDATRETSAPLDIAAGFLTIHPFRTFFIADLDRIESRGSHESTLSALSVAFKDVVFWVDAECAIRRSALLARSPRRCASRPWQ